MDSRNETLQSFVYDPAVLGYDANFFRTNTGTPAISGGKLRLTNASVNSYPEVSEGTVTFRVTIPTAPTVGDLRVWGLGLSSSNQHTMVFYINGTTFTLYTYDQDGNAADATVIPWSSDWTNVAVDYSISFTDGAVQYTIKGPNVSASHIYKFTNKIVNLAVGTQISNGGGNMDVSYIIYNNVVSTPIT